MWLAANVGKNITEGQLAYFKGLTDEFVKRVDAAINSGKIYRTALIEHLGEYNRERVLAEIKRIDGNEEIFNKDKSIALADYERIKIHTAISAIEPDPKDKERSWKEYEKEQFRTIPGFEVVFSVFIFTSFTLLRSRASRMRYGAFLPGRGHPNTSRR